MPMFKKPELDRLAEVLATSAKRSITMALSMIAPLEDVEAKAGLSIETIAGAIGSNGAMAVVETLSELLPAIDADLQASARSMIWASQESSGGRAGLSGAGQRFLDRALSNDAEGALAELERRLFALFLAARHLRRLPAECAFAHRIDPNTGVCINCKEKVRQ